MPITECYEPHRITLLILAVLGLIGAGIPLVDQIRRCVRFHSPSYHNDTRYLDEQIARVNVVQGSRCWQAIWASLEA